MKKLLLVLTLFVSLVSCSNKSEVESLGQITEAKVTMFFYNYFVCGKGFESGDFMDNNRSARLRVIESMAAPEYDRMIIEFSDDEDLSFAIIERNSEGNPSVMRNKDFKLGLTHSGKIDGRFGFLVYEFYSERESGELKIVFIDYE